MAFTQHSLPYPAYILMNRRVGFVGYVLCTGVKLMAIVIGNFIIYAVCYVVSLA